jgi:hypothetical protein
MTMDPQIPTVGPPTDSATARPATVAGMPQPRIPLTPEQITIFKKEIDRARQLREEKIIEWQVEENVKRYAPAAKTDSGVNVGVDFRDVERKGAALFYDTPHVSVLPGPEGHPQAAVLHQEVLNGLLSAQKMNAKATALKAIKNCLVTIQPAFTVIGYSPTTVEVADPLTQVPTPVTVHDEVFWSHFSAQAGLLPVDFRDTDYDKSPWIGQEWKKPVSQVRREYGFPEDWQPAAGSDRRVTFGEHKDPAGSGDPPVGGVTLWYYAHRFDETVSHPEVIRILVFVDGYDEQPVKHENVPWQTLDPMGRLTPDSVRGYPIHPLTLRDFPDSAWVPADSSQTGPMTKEINAYLGQAKGKRESNRLILLVDVDQIDTDGIARIADMKPLEHLDLSIVPVKGDALARGADAVMKQVPTLDLGRETYLGLEIFEQKRDQILGISAPQGGVRDKSARTATEITTVQRNADARFEQERQRALEWWLAGVRKLSALVVKYGERCAEEILGPQRAQQWLQFRDQGLLGRFTFEVAIDSGKYLDVEADRRQFLQVVNFAAKSPFINQKTLWMKFCEKFGYDPTQWIVDPQPPKPEPPALAVSSKAEDFVLPQGVILLEIMKQLGYEIPPGAIKLAMGMKLMMPAEGGAGNEAQPAVNPETPAQADKAPRLDQHQLDETGGLSGPGPM